MNLERGNKPIAPALVAAKLEKVKNFESNQIAGEIEAEPRFVEMLWFLQWASNSDNYPGGMARFALDLIAESESLLGPDSFRQIGPVKKYTPAQIDKLREDAIIPCEEDWIDLMLDRKPKHWAAAPTYHELLNDYCSEARARLPDYLFDLCENPFRRFTREGNGWKDLEAPRYFPRVGEAVLAFMDRRKARIAATIGETEITKEISRWLEVARCAKRTVLIVGTERFGKTEAVKNWCLQNPGIVRIVQTPASNAESDLLREVAKALGIDPGPVARGYKLRQMIDYVLAHSGLMLIFDEAQFIIPSTYSRTTAPARLNWFRRNIMDKGIASALVATPQSYGPSKNRFVKHTGFAIGQFDERILKTVILPDELKREDLLAIARIHFPSLHQKYLEYVVETTLATQRNFVSDIEKIAALARVNADQAGRKTPGLEDIKSAIADVLPRAVEEREEAIESPSASPMQSACTAPAKAHRGTRPAQSISGHNRLETLAELPG